MLPSSVVLPQRRVQCMPSTVSDLTLSRHGVGRVLCLRHALGQRQVPGLDKTRMSTHAEPDATGSLKLSVDSTESLGSAAPGRVIRAD